jgi:hypothetical protein
MVIGNKPCASKVFTRNLHPHLTMSPRKRRSAALVANQQRCSKMSQPSLYDLMKRHQIGSDARWLFYRYFAVRKESQWRVVKGAIGGAA